LTYTPDMAPNQGMESPVTCQAHIAWTPYVTAAPLGTGPSPSNTDM